MVDPAVLCRQHLLGEHVELHMIVGSVRKGRDLTWMLDRGLLEPSRVEERHAALVTEMRRRGYGHRSPICPTVCYAVKGLYGVTGEQLVDPRRSVKELAERCAPCRHRINLTDQRRETP